MACASFIAIAIVSLLPESWKATLRITGPLHLPLHFGVFALAGLLAFAPGAPLRSRIRWCVAIVALACVSEVLQARLAGNRVERRDVAADIGGILAAMLGTHVASRRDLFTR